MWIADQWKDYEVIDCSKGREGSERWGNTSWFARIPRSSGTLKNDRGWKHKNGHYHRSKRAAENGIHKPPGTMADTL